MGDENLQRNRDDRNNNGKKKKKTPTEILYIHEDETQENHYFSDSWLLNRDRFLEMDIEKIYRIEDAAIIAAWETYSEKPLPHAKMPYDWTDFNVEHLSKWWGMLKVFNKEVSDLFPHVISILQNYLRRQLSPSSMMAATTTAPELKN